MKLFNKAVNLRSWECMMFEVISLDAHIILTDTGVI